MTAHSSTHENTAKISEIGQLHPIVYQVNRYVERNALRALIVDRAEDGPFGSLWIRQHGTGEHRALLSSWPVPKPREWKVYVNEPASEAELAALRRSVTRGTPYGSPS